MTSSSFLSELKRRLVFRTAAVYAVVGWATVQVSDVMFPRLTLPDWSVTLVVALVILGFPLVLTLAWTLAPPQPVREMPPADVEPAATTAREPAPDGKDGATQRSIVVLPFADMSPGKDHDYFSDGLAEEIISALTQVPGLKVIARTSAFSFKGQPTDVRRIGEALGVTHVLEGSVRKAGDRIRVTAQLIEAAGGSHLWSRRFDGDLEDVFAIQDEIADSIASALHTELSSVDVPPLRSYMPSLPAYESFLKGRHHLQRFTKESLVRARTCMEEAIRLDPGFASAHGELGLCFFGLVTENVLLPGEAVPLMEAAGRKALEIDRSLPEAHAALGLASVLEYDWAEAGTRFAVAMSRAAVAPSVRWPYSTYYLAPVGRLDEAAAEIDRALVDDPLNLLLRLLSAWFAFGRGREAEGETKLQQTLELNENFWIPYLWLSTLRLRQGRVPDAFDLAERAYSLVPWHWFARGLFAGLLERTGDRSRAAALVQELGDGAAFGAPAGHVCYHLAQGDVDAAADWYEKLIDQRDTRAPWILSRLWGDALLSSPRWPALARRMNLA